MKGIIRFLKYNRIRILQIIVVFIVVILAFGIIWVSTPYKATSASLELLKSTNIYDFFSTQNLEFIPTSSSDKGVIFYPGGRVEASAYAYICEELANNGYPCIIATMPLNLAVLKINSGTEIINKFPDVDSWIIGGHSLGGSMAARFVKDNPSKIRGIFFLASYTDVDLSKTSLKALTIIGSEDSILNAQAYKDNYKFLPEEREIIVIQGGNHSQFGDYGLQEGDLEPKISKEEQHQIVAEGILKLLI